MIRGAEKLAAAKTGKSIEQRLEALEKWSIEICAVIRHLKMRPSS
jgi:hypothetical protein